MIRLALTLCLFIAIAGCVTNTMRDRQRANAKAKADSRLNEEIARQRVEIELLRRDMLQEFQWYTWTHPRKWWVN